MRIWHYLFLSSVMLCGLAVSIGAVTGSARPADASAVHRIVPGEPALLHRSGGLDR